MAFVVVSEIVKELYRLVLLEGGIIWPLTWIRVLFKLASLRLVIQVLGDYSADNIYSESPENKHSITLRNPVQRCH